MSTKMLLLVGGAALVAYVLFSRRTGNHPTVNSAPGANGSVVGASIAAGSKILGALLGSGGSSARVGGTGSPSGFVTSYDQLSDSKVVGNGFVTSYD